MAITRRAPHFRSSTGGGKNWTGWGDPSYDRMLAQAAREADPQARLEIFQGGCVDRGHAMAVARYGHRGRKSANLQSAIELRKCGARRVIAIARQRRHNQQQGKGDPEQNARQGRPPGMGCVDFCQGAHQNLRLYSRRSAAGWG
jgi:hypothetical protein